MNLWLRRTAKLFAVIGATVAVLVGVMTVTSIIGRALWARPVQGDVEITQFGIALCISLCLPWAQWRRANIIVDFFTQGWPARAQQRMDSTGAMLLAAMCLLLAWRSAVGAQGVREAGEASMVLDLPMWWVYASLSPGLALTAAVALWQAQRRWRGLALEEANVADPEARA